MPIPQSLNHANPPLRRMHQNAPTCSLIWPQAGVKAVLPLYRLRHHPLQTRPPTSLHAAIFANPAPTQTAAAVCVCVCVMLQLWTAQPPPAEWIRQGQPAHSSGMGPTSR
eukprot:360434-Chlamydomonas_euryale.AAC.3